MNLYETSVMRAITGPAIRPGGFELTDRALAYCRMNKGTRVVDVGCGTGAGVDRLRRVHAMAAVGVDLSAALLQEGGRLYAESPLVQGRAEKLPLPNDFCGVVLCECVLSLCTKPESVLQEFKRILQPGGHLILTDLYARSSVGTTFQGNRTVQCCLQGAVDRLTVERRIGAAGFEVVVWEDHTCLLKQLAAQIVWEHGSLDAFWSAVAGPEAAGRMHSGSDLCRRPGYYLAVVRKSDSYPSINALNSLNTSRSRWNG